jgi:hypothetical protein
VFVSTGSGSDPIKVRLEWMIPSLPLPVLTWWYGEGCFDSRRPGNSDVERHSVRTESGSDRIMVSTWTVKSKPSAVADGCSFNFEISRRSLCRPLRGLGFRGSVIPGRHSPRSLARGYYLPSLRDSLTQTSTLTLC